MQYNGSSYQIEYKNSHFDSALELAWFLFLCELEITKNNLSSHPVDYKKDLSWYPDLRFVLFNPTYSEVMVEVKPLSKSEFTTELNLYKYVHSDSVTLLLGKSNSDYLLLKKQTEITPILDENFLNNKDMWNICYQKAIDFAQKYGSTKKTDFIQNDPKISFGKYEGHTLREVKEKDPSYYSWYMDTFD